MSMMCKRLRCFTKMPKVSERQKCLKFCRNTATLGILLNSSSEDSSDSGDMKCDFLLDSEESSIDMVVASSSDSEGGSGAIHLDDVEWNVEAMLELQVVIDNSRFISDHCKNLHSKEFADHFLKNVIAPDLFKQIVRMDKATFFTLLNLIEGLHVFQNKAIVQQAPVSIQLSVCLDRLGHDGNGVCNKRTHLLWGVGYGTIQNFTRRCFVALESAIGNGIKWPDQVQRSTILEAFKEKGFPGCVGLIDGTLLPLSQRPKTDGECYFDRKSPYSMNAQVVCDHQMRINFLYIGMPGSCQVVTCLKRSSLWDKMHADDIFDSGQYLLGDSGYVCAPHLVAAYKVTGNDQDKVNFNTCVAKTRYINEHTIGVLKNRWFSLKGLGILLNERRHNKYMVRWIMVCAMLHNFLLDNKDEWPEDWTEQNNETEEDLAEVDDDSSQRMSPAKILLAKVQQTTLTFHRKPGGCLSD